MAKIDSLHRFAVAITPLLLLIYSFISTANATADSDRVLTKQWLAAIATTERIEDKRNAYLNLSNQFATGTESLPQNARAALRLYHHAAQMGYPNSGLSALSGVGPGYVVQHQRRQPPTPVANSLVFTLDEYDVMGDLPLHVNAELHTQSNASDFLSIWALKQQDSTADSSWADSGSFDRVFWHIGEYSLLAVALDQEGRLYRLGKTVSVTRDTDLPTSPDVLNPKNAQSVSHTELQTFEWVMANGATSYYVEVYSPDSQLLVRIGPLLAADVCHETLCITESARGFVLPGVHQWRVYGLNAMGLSDIAQGEFTVEYPQPAQFCPVADPDTQPYVVEPLPLTEGGDFPLALGVASIDPAFGKPVTRITDNSPGSSSFTRHVYSTMQPWNADESLLLMYHNDGNVIEHRLYDGNTYEFIKPLVIQPSDIEDIFWSYHDSTSLFYLPRTGPYRGFLIAHNVLTGEEEPMADFRAVCGANRPVAGIDVQMHSLDNDLFGFRCGDGSDQTMIAYRHSANELKTASLGDDSDWYPWIAPVPFASGNGFYLNGFSLTENLEAGTTPLDLNSFFEHSSLGMTATGDSALFQVSFGASPNGCGVDSSEGVGQIIMHNLDSGECAGLVTGDQGYPYPHSGTHVSAISYKQPGWVVASSIGNTEQLQTYVVPNVSNSPAPPLLNEIYLASADSDNRAVCRLAHHRSFGSRAVNGSYTKYFGEPHPVLSPSGTRVLFASDWYDSGSVNAYVIDLD